MSAQDLAERVRQKRDDILRIAANHGVLNVKVFGSVARGDAGPDSDLDLLVERGQKRTFFFPGGLVEDLETLLGCHVDVVTERSLHPMLREKVLREARSL